MRPFTPDCVGGPFRRDIDSNPTMPILKAVTATQVIRQLEKLPARERRKVFAYVDSALERREDIEDRRAIAEVRRDPRPAVSWKVVKGRIGLA